MCPSSKSNSPSESCLKGHVFFIFSSYQVSMFLKEKIISFGGKIDTFFSRYITVVLVDDVHLTAPHTFAQDYSIRASSYTRGSFANPSFRFSALREFNLCASGLSYVNDRVNRIIERAKQLGIQILGIGEFSAWVESEVKARAANVSELRGYHIKIEADSRTFRPCFKMFNSDPKCLMPLQNVDKPLKLTEGLDKPNGDQSPHFNHANDAAPKAIKHNEKRTPTGENVKAKAQNYCECCNMHFTDLNKHLKSEKHQSFIEDDKNFQNVYNVIKTIPSVNNLVKNSKSDEEPVPYPPTTLESDISPPMLPNEPGNLPDLAKNANYSQEENLPPPQLPEDAPHEDSLLDKCNTSALAQLCLKNFDSYWLDNLPNEMDEIVFDDNFFDFDDPKSKPIEDHVNESESTPIASASLEIAQPSMLYLNAQSSANSPLFLNDVKSTLKNVPTPDFPEFEAFSGLTKLDKSEPAELEKKFYLEQNEMYSIPPACSNVLPEKNEQMFSSDSSDDENGKVFINNVLDIITNSDNEMRVDKDFPTVDKQLLELTSANAQVPPYARPSTSTPFPVNPSIPMSPEVPSHHNLSLSRLSPPQNDRSFTPEVSPVTAGVATVESSSNNEATPRTETSHISQGEEDNPSDVPKIKRFPPLWSVSVVPGTGVRLKFTCVHPEIIETVDSDLDDVSSAEPFSSDDSDSEYP